MADCNQVNADVLLKAFATAMKSDSLSFRIFAEFPNVLGFSRERNLPSSPLSEIGFPAERLAHSVAGRPDPVAGAEPPTTLIMPAGFRPPPFIEFLFAAPIFSRDRSYQERLSNPGTKGTQNTCPIRVFTIHQQHFQSTGIRVLNHGAV